MDETAATHPRRGYRRMVIVVWVTILLLAGLLGGGIHLFRTEGELFWIIFSLEASVLVVLPVFTVKAELHFVTDRSAVDVREEFKNGDHPIAAWSAALADGDGTEAHENGVAYETSALFGLRTGTVSYETEQQSNGDLLVRTRRNGSESVRNTVSIEATDEGGAMLTMAGGPVDRKHILWLLQMVARGSCVQALFGEFGYGIVDASLDVGVRKS